MHFTLLVAGALIPDKLATELTPLLDIPNLKTRLSRAMLIETIARSSDADADGCTAHLDWLARKLFHQAPPAPTAPYAFGQISGTTPISPIWHADPVHIEIARDHLVVQTFDGDGPTAEESRHLVGIANELLAEGDCELVIVDDRWFLATERQWTIDAAPLSGVNGRPVSMPTGADANAWTRLHNEIQMAWHTHSVNAAREANGRRTVNALWLYGGGCWKPLRSIEFAQVHCHAPEWQGAARAAGAHGARFDDNVIDSALLISDDVVLAREREDWSAWLRAMKAIDVRLGDHADDAIDIVLTGASARSYASRPSDRYRPWRRRALAEALTE
ncbi:MAG: hypothetical protein ABJA83_00825 [Burkholderiaceae bacterium]